jgi:hypothetical protein
MGSSNTGAAAVAWLATLSATAACCSRVYAQDAPELAKLVQNPIAKVISLPLQNNRFPVWGEPGSPLALPHC